MVITIFHLPLIPRHPDIHHTAVLTQAGPRNAI